MNTQTVEVAISHNPITAATEPKYRLKCHGCSWSHEVPRAFYLTKAIAWGHQHQLPGNRERHVVEFIFVGGTDGK